MALFITIKAVPSSGKRECTIDKAGKIKCYLTSAPERGKANAELIKYLSKQLKIPQKNITIVRGATSRTKELKIDGELEIDQFCNKLGLEMQQRIV